MVATEILKNGYKVIYMKFNQIKEDCVKLIAEYAKHHAYIRKISNHIDDARVNPIIVIIYEIQQGMTSTIRSKLDISTSVNAESIDMGRQTSVRRNQAAANAVNCVENLLNNLKSVLYRCRSIKNLVNQELEICRQNADFNDQYGKFVDSLTFEG